MTNAPLIITGGTSDQRAALLTAEINNASPKTVWLDRVGSPSIPDTLDRTPDMLNTNSSSEQQSAFLAAALCLLSSRQHMPEDRRRNQFTVVMAFERPFMLATEAGGNTSGNSDTDGLSVLFTSGRAVDIRPMLSTPYPSTVPGYVRSIADVVDAAEAEPPYELTWCCGTRTQKRGVGATGPN